MKAPRTRRAMLALVLAALGGLFTLLGLVSCVVPIPMRGGEGWMFLTAGLPLLLAGGMLALSAWRRGRAETRLRTEGRPVSAQVLKIQRHPLVGFGSDGIHKRHPWTVLCAYQWEDGTRFVRSGFLWEPPCEDGQRPVVYLDPRHPGRAYLDPESLRYEARPFRSAQP